MRDGHVPVRKLNVLCIAVAPGTLVVVRMLLEIDLDLSVGTSCEDSTTTGAALRIHLMRERLEIARSSAFRSFVLLRRRLIVFVSIRDPQLVFTVMGSITAMACFTVFGGQPSLSTSGTS